MTDKDMTLDFTGNYALELLDDQYFFLPVTTAGVRAEKLFALNEIGSSIVKLIDGKKNVNAIVDRLSEEYEADREIISGDVQEFVTLLIENRIVKITD